MSAESLITPLFLVGSITLLGYVKYQNKRHGTKAESIYLGNFDHNKIYPDLKTIIYDYEPLSVPFNYQDNCPLPEPYKVPELEKLELHGYKLDSLPYYQNLRKFIYIFYKDTISKFNIILPENALKLKTLHLSSNFKKVPFYINIKWYILNKYNCTIYAVKPNHKILLNLFHRASIREKYLLVPLIPVYKKEPILEPNNFLPPLPPLDPNGQWIITPIINNQIPPLPPLSYNLIPWNITQITTDQDPL
jgi:hypothetical protein